MTEAAVSRIARARARPTCAGIPLLLALAVPLLLPSLARADCDPPPTALALLSQGNERRRANDDVGALALFQKAYEESRCGRALAQVGLAEKAIGRWLDAERHLGAALATSGEKWIEKYRDSLVGEQAACAQHLGDLELVLDGPVPEGAEVAIDGGPWQPLSPSGSLRLTAGSAALVVRAPGCMTITRMVLVPAGGKARESLRFTAAPTTDAPAAPEAVAVPAAKAAPPEPPPATTPGPATDAAPELVLPAPGAGERQVGGTRRPAVLGAGVALLTAGLGMGAASLATALVARSHYATLVDTCGPSGDQCPPGSAAIRDEGARLEIAGYALAPVAALAAAAGVALVVLEARRAPAAKTVLLPVAGAGYAGLVFSGAF